MRNFIPSAAFLTILFAGVQSFPADRHTALVTDGIQYTGTVSGPSISFSLEHFHFGVVSQGDTLEHTFTFRNDGTEPLLLEKLTAS